MVRTLFDNFAVFQNNDAIEAGDSRKTVSNNETGAIFHELFEGLLDERFGFGVESRSCFVQNENWGIFQNSTSDSNTLTLTARKFDASFAD